jgi:1,4-alpha-glucan branching enzyme
MGEEWGETNPFCFFTDFHGELADKVREGRRREFAGFAAFAATSVESIPDPNALSTFRASRIDRNKARTEDGKAWLTFFRVLLNVRHEHIVPLLAGAGGNAGKIVAVGDGVIAIDWHLHGGTLSLRANLSREQQTVPPPAGTIVYAYPAEAEHAQDGLSAHAVLAGIDLRPSAGA